MAPNKSVISIHVPLLFVLLLLLLSLLADLSHGRKTLRDRNSTVHVAGGGETPVYLWPLPKEFSRGAQTLSVDPNLTIETEGAGGNSLILIEAFRRYKSLIFAQESGNSIKYDVGKLKVIVASDDETLQFGVDEKYNLYISAGGIGRSIIDGATIEATTIYGALRGLEYGRTDL